MKKRLFFSALTTAVVLTAGYCGYRHVVNSSESDLFLANVEALSEEEQPKMLDCSVAIASKGCYKPGPYGDVWACEVIMDVRVYQVVVGFPIVCHHDIISDCPYGTFEK